MGARGGMGVRWGAGICRSREIRPSLSKETCRLSKETCRLVKIVPSVIDIGNKLVKIANKKSLYNVLLSFLVHVCYGAKSKVQLLFDRFQIRSGFDLIINV